MTQTPVVGLPAIPGSTPARAQASPGAFPAALTGAGILFPIIGLIRRA